MSLRNRCETLWQQMQHNAMFQQGSPVDDLMTFVIVERGRAEEKGLEKAFALCLYFSDHHDREDCIELIQEFKPKTIAKRMP